MLEGIGSSGGGGIGMDSSVVPSHRYPDLFVVSTTDFFFPLVEDPYVQGRIAACNVLSDMYAMGVHEVDNVLMLIACAIDMKPEDRQICTRLMMKGFDDTCRLAGTAVTGGQTVFNPWPMIGGVAKSICKKADIIMPVGAVAGDVLVLTKPLGCQVAVNMKQWMNREEKWSAVIKIIPTLKEDGWAAYRQAMKQMSRLNRTGAQLMHKHSAHAATDVTGFGLAGHASNLASNQTADVSFVIHTLPCIKHTPKVNEKCHNFKLFLGLSAETSGGLLIAMPRDKAELFLKDIMEAEGEPAWIIGDVISGGGRKATIKPDAKILEH